MRAACFENLNVRAIVGLEGLANILNDGAVETGAIVGVDEGPVSANGEDSPYFAMLAVATWDVLVN